MIAPISGKPLWIGIAVIVILTAISTIAIKSCIEKKTVVITPTEHTIDSVNAWRKESDRVIDSLKKANQRQAWEKDSVSWKNMVLDHELDEKTIRINTLVTAAKLEKKYNDTVAYVQTCDSLLPQIDTLTAAAKNFQLGARALQNSYDSLLSTTSLLIAKQDYDLGELKRKFDEVATTSIGFEKENKKLSKPKRIVGYIGAGEAFDGFKLRPSLHVGVGIKLFQF